MTWSDLLPSVPIAMMVALNLWANARTVRKTREIRDELYELTHENTERIVNSVTQYAATAEEKSRALSQRELELALRERALQRPTKNYN